MTGQARVLHTQQTHYFRKRVTLGDAGLSAGIIFGTLPAGAMLVGASVRVNTAFDAGTTNVLQVGTTATGGEILATAVTLSGAAGYKAATSGTAFAASFANDTDIYVSYTQTGTAATVGQADVFVAFVPDNDK